MINNYAKVEEILKSYRKKLNVPTFDMSPKIQMIGPFIHEYLFDPKLTICWMKEQCHLRSKSLATKFALSTGFKPKDYILHHRINATKQLLERTEATITMIALSVGFRSLSSLDKTFKNRVGVRPSTWRKKSRKV